MAWPCVPSGSTVCSFSRRNRLRRDARRPAPPAGGGVRSRGQSAGPGSQAGAAASAAAITPRNRRRVQSVRIVEFPKLLPGVRHTRPAEGRPLPYLSANITEWLKKATRSRPARYGDRFVSPVITEPERRRLFTPVLIPFLAISPPHQLNRSRIQESVLPCPLQEAEFVALHGLCRCSWRSRCSARFRAFGRGERSTCRL